jgi:hypothetical protein
MKKFLLTALLYYVILSLVIGFVTLLTGIHGVIWVRIIMALALAYFRPLNSWYGKDNNKW